MQYAFINIVLGEIDSIAPVPIIGRAKPYGSVWVLVFFVLPLPDFQSLTGGALMLRVMSLIFLFVSCVPGSGYMASV
jgi:hypothetical protein